MELQNKIKCILNSKKTVTGQTILPTIFVICKAIETPIFYISIPTLHLHFVNDAGFTLLVKL